jgi:competence protein ComEC
VIANLVAMPVVSGWVMPWGILGLLAMPLGLDGPCWSMMGLGIDLMTAVALWVTTIPGALGRMAAFGAGPLLLCTLGLVILCLLKTPLRFIGSLLMGCAVVMMIRAPQPDVLIAADGTAAAIRGRDGRLAMVHSGGDVFALREWLAADGDARAPKDTTVANGIDCDEAGCIGKLKDGSLVAIVKRVDAFEEDCRRAILVISARQAPPDCGALTIDQRVWRASGAMALRRIEGRFEIAATRPRGYDRPWARDASHLAEGSEPNRSPNPQPRDATPNAQDLEAGD